jgi:hypothetical protein
MIIWQDLYLSIVKVFVEDEKNSLSIDLHNIPLTRHHLFEVFFANPDRNYKIYAFVANSNKRIKEALQFTYDVDSLEEKDVLNKIATLEGVEVDYVSNNYRYYTFNKLDVNDSFGVLYFHV